MIRAVAYGWRATVAFDVTAVIDGVLVPIDAGYTAIDLDLEPITATFPATGLPIGTVAPSPGQMLVVNVYSDGAPIVLAPPNPILAWGGIGAAIWSLDGDQRVSSTFPGGQDNWSFTFMAVGNGVWVELARSSVAFPPP